MINILLVCNAGMSTSILVKKMKEVAAEQNIEASILAIADSEINAHWQQAQVILLGPQVSYLRAKMEGIVGNSIPVEAINMLDYGRINGQAVLAAAIALIEKNEAQG